MPLDADLSSFPKPVAPQNPLDIASKLGSMQSQALQIDTQKLNLYNQHFQIMNNELSNIANDPEATPSEALKKMHTIGDMFNMPKAIRQKMEAEFAGIPNVPLGKKIGPNGEVIIGADNPQFNRTLDMVLRRGMDMNQRLNAQYGAPGTVQNNSTITPSRQGLRGGPVPSGAPIAIQQPPTQSEVDPITGKPTFRGSQEPEIPPNTLPVQGGFPGQYQTAPLPKPDVQVVPTQPKLDQSRLPIRPTPVPTPPVTGPLGQYAGPRGGSAGLPPGVSEAETIAGGASGKQLALERERSANFQREIFPLMEAIPALEELGTKNTGPGSEALNNVKSFILTMMPGVKETDPAFASVPTYDKAKKYLTDFVNQNSAGGTNDRLAASFAGNPSVGISNAAAQDVAKSAMALARMRQALQLQWEKEKLPASQFSRWMVNKVQETDPRAFGLDMMDEAKVKKLYATVDKNPIESKRFDASLDIAHNLGFITPPSKKR